VSEFAIDQ